MTMFEMTVWEKMLDVTSEIWDDRHAYILACLEALGIDPQMPWPEWEAKR
jgi:hypothetical protein